jgi:molybdate transport system ATP-binding protein
VRASGPTAELIARLDLPLAQGDAAATVVTGTVIEHAPQDHITCVAFAGAAAAGQPPGPL